MTDLDTKAKHVRPERGAAPDRPDLSAGSDSLLPGAATRRRPSWLFRVFRVLMTLTAVGFALPLAWRMWGVYMAAPWTRDASVRAYVVTMASEVAGRIAELPVRDNQFVQKGDPLVVIDPTDFRIAVSQAEAAAQQAQASIQSIDAQMTVQLAQIASTRAQLDGAQAGLTFAQQEALRYGTLTKEGWASVQKGQQTSSQLNQQGAAVQSAQANLKLTERQLDALKAQRAGADATLAQAKAQLSQARVNLERTRIHAPASGYVTNLLTRVGDYATVGENLISVVDSDSFWVDGYFEETNLASVREGDRANIKLMGYSQIVRGRVGSIARGINVANAQPNNQGVASVNPIFTWVRLAQRIPVRIQIDEVPPGIVLAAGMTATVEIDDRTRAPAN
jgi:multidrug resistance efflux pump